MTKANVIASAWVKERTALKTEIERLQKVIDSRPAINAALPDSYIKWSQSIYEMEFAHSRKIVNG